MSNSNLMLKIPQSEIDKLPTPRNRYNSIREIQIPDSHDLPNWL